MTARFARPPRWSDEELDKNRQKAELLFKLRRRREGPAQYRWMYESVEAEVSHALEVTDALLGLDAAALETNDELWGVLRYFCGPQVSEEDFWTLVGKKFKRFPPGAGATAAELLGDLIDLHRFPWFATGRRPSDGEREAAILATATLLAHERLRTHRRGNAAKNQEDLVASTLLEVGLKQIPDERRTAIELIDDLPKGHFCREQKVGGAKCDVPVRLPDGRLMAIECKVSNGPKNGWKRLLREVGGKSETWRQKFGNQLVATAVVAGVFDLSCLKRAQTEHSVAVFWEHDLAALQSFVRSTRK